VANIVGDFYTVLVAHRLASGIEAWNVETDGVKSRVISVMQWSCHRQARGISLSHFHEKHGERESP